MDGSCRGYGIFKPKIGAKIVIYVSFRYNNSKRSLRKLYGNPCSQIFLGCGKRRNYIKYSRCPSCDTNYIKAADGLEEELGTQLFVRGRCLLLTDAGVMLHCRAEEVVNLMDKMEEEFDALEDLGYIISIGSGVMKSSGILSGSIL